MADKRKKRQRRQVVSEQEYTSSLDTIIQRDYYSDLPDLQLKMAVLNRRSQKDHVGAVRVRRAARKLKNHEIALTEQEEAAESNLDGGGFRKKARPLHRQNLTGFHSRVTSEDNVEFERTQQQEVTASRERLELMFQTPAERQQLLLKENGENYDANDNNSFPALASDEFNPPPSRISFTEWEKPQARNGLFFAPSPAVPANSGKNLSLKNKNGADQTTADETDRETRALMPPPSQANNQTIISSVTASNKQQLVEFIPKYKLEKKIESSQTRFPMSEAIATCLQEHRAITTLERPRNGTVNNESDTEYSTDASTDLDSDGHSLHTERRARVKRQIREQQTFVNMTPLVVPGGATAGDIEASPIVTWGTVAGTPLLIRPINSSIEDQRPSSRHRALLLPKKMSEIWQQEKLWKRWKNEKRWRNTAAANPWKRVAMASRVRKRDPPAPTGAMYPLSAQLPCRC